MDASINTSMLFGFLLFVMRPVLMSPACIDRGKRLVHAYDCRRSRR